MHPPHTHTNTLSYTFTNLHTFTYSHTLTDTFVHSYTFTYSLTLTNTYTHIHIYIHTYVSFNIKIGGFFLLHLEKVNFKYSKCLKKSCQPLVRILGSIFDFFFKENREGKQIAYQFKSCRIKCCTKSRTVRTKVLPIEALELVLLSLAQK